MDCLDPFLTLFIVVWKTDNKNHNSKPLVPYMGTLRPPSIMRPNAGLGAEARIGMNQQSFL